MHDWINKAARSTAAKIESEETQKRLELLRRDQFEAGCEQFWDELVARVGAAIEHYNEHPAVTYKIKHASSVFNFHADQDDRSVRFFMSLDEKSQTLTLRLGNRGHWSDRKWRVEAIDGKIVISGIAQDKELERQILAPFLEAI